MDEAYPLWKASDIYLRPTSTDGDAVAIREALSLGTPVVASDIVSRPQGVNLYHHREQSGFFETVSAVLENRQEIRTSLRRLPSVDRFEDIARIYQTVSS